MNPCTCHISNLRCKNENCSDIIKARGTLKIEISHILYSLMTSLREGGCGKKESVTALRRELKRKNNLQWDMFDEAAHKIWID